MQKCENTIPYSSELERKNSAQRPPAPSLGFFPAHPPHLEFLHLHKPTTTRNRVRRGGGGRVLDNLGKDGTEKMRAESLQARNVTFIRGVKSYTRSVSGSVLDRGNSKNKVRNNLAGLESGETEAGGRCVMACARAKQAAALRICLAMLGCGSSNALPEPNQDPGCVCGW
jgi:hypothetical protein